jgi:predicted Zn-dependent protease
VDFFEKIETLEKRKPGTVSKLFATHPPTDDRVGKSQKEIAQILKAKPEYVVTTSEFNDVKARLAMLENQRRPDKSNEDPNKPTLRRSPNSTTPIEDETDPSKKSKGDEDDRPKLKRRPTDTSGSGGLND